MDTSKQQYSRCQEAGNEANAPHVSMMNDVNNHWNTFHNNLDNAGENFDDCGVAPSEIVGINETSNTTTRLRNLIVETGESSRGPIDIVKLDDRILNGRGPKPFSIYGELKHRVGALLLDLGKRAAYVQLYIYDSASALNAGVSCNLQLNTDVLKIIQDNFMEYNPFVRIYHQAYEVLNDAYSADNQNVNVHAHLHYSSRTD
ncbi:hypothetical protein GIB67_026057 [Kingdonia uniflora]|uniref:Helitron helicase-like domain-containing protein n=1 Tax=Kingdonia uniflora TaxID=39325 RepID=A0A7J7M2V8_9MAGN|nr:hypothetical protein GIB67_026057 [Kingdonia uniflora]